MGLDLAGAQNRLFSKKRAEKGVPGTFFKNRSKNPPGDGSKLHREPGSFPLRRGFRGTRVRKPVFQSSVMGLDIRNILTTSKANTGGDALFPETMY